MYEERRALHYQTDTDKLQCEQTLSATGQALFRVSRSGRFYSCMAVFKGHTATACLESELEEWLKFYLFVGFSHWVSNVVFFPRLVSLGSVVNKWVHNCTPCLGEDPVFA